MELQKRFDMGGTVGVYIDGKTVQVGLQKLLKYYSKNDELTTADFKVALGTLNMFGQYDLDNMTKYLDIKNAGWLKVDEVMA